MAQLQEMATEAATQNSGATWMIMGNMTSRGKLAIQIASLRTTFSSKTAAELDLYFPFSTNAFDQTELIQELIHNSQRMER